jgi:uracil-DNA glycosylase family 4
MPSLRALTTALTACQRCPRLIAHCRQVAQEKRRAYKDEVYWGKPVPGGGDPLARVLLVGLAPGAHGSNRTGRMFTGDGSADFLTPALHRAHFSNSPISIHRHDGLQLRDLYIIAAAHCAPPDNQPTPQEIANCRPYFIQHLRLLKQVRVIVALGKIAFDSTLATLAEMDVDVPSPRPHFGHNVEYRVGDYVLIGSYHPSRQNTQTGKLTAAMLDAVFAKVKLRLPQ